MKANNWVNHKIVTPGEAIKEFMKSYAATMNCSLQVIINIIHRAKRESSHQSMNACLKQAHETVDNMKTGLELMRKNILNRMRIK